MTLSDYFDELRRYKYHEKERICINCGKENAKRFNLGCGVRHELRFCDKHCVEAWKRWRELEKRLYEMSKEELIKLIESKYHELVNTRKSISELSKEIRARDHKFGRLAQICYREKAALKQELEKTEEQLNNLKNFLSNKRDESEEEWIRRYGDPVNWELLKKACLKRDNYMCVVCKSIEDLRVHHLIPLSKGGKNELTNMITLCLKHHKEQHPDNPYIF